MKRLLVFVILSCCAAVASAQNNWIRPPGTPGAWLDPANWSQAVPTATLGGIINNGGTAIINSAIQVRTIDIATASSYSGHVELQGGSVTFFYDSYIGRSGTGTFTQTGGRLSHNYNVYMGNDSFSSGTYTLRNGDAGFSTLFVGFNGAGTFIQESGNVTVSKRFGLAEGSTGTGRYELRGGTLDLYMISSAGATIPLAYNGDADFIHTGGTNTVHSKNLAIGYWAGTCRYEISGDAVLNVERDMIIGDEQHSSGTFTQTGGTTNITGKLYVGRTGPHTDSVCEISGGTLRASGIVFGTGGGESLLRISGTPDIAAGSYSQSSNGELVCIIGPGGIAPIELTGGAGLAGKLVITDAGAPLGLFPIIDAPGGFTGDFSQVVLPSDHWSYGLTGGQLWVEHVPEPASSCLLGLGGLALLRRRRRR